MKSPKDQTDNRQRGGRPFMEEKPTAASGKMAGRPPSINGLPKERT